MAIVEIEISINRKEYFFSKCNFLKIDSVYNNHHTFEIHLPISIENSISFKTIKEVWGEYIDIKYAYPESDITGGHFRGLVDEIITRWNPDGHKVLVVKGYSPTILMDCAPVFRGFTDKTVKDIIDTIMKPYQRFNLPSLEQENTGKKVDWSLQVQETDFQKLNRLSDEVGLAFYYNGTNLKFGNFRKKSQAPIPLVIGSSLNSVELSLNLAPLRFSLKGYDGIAEKMQNAKSGRFNNVNPFVAAALEKSPYPIPNIIANHTVEGVNSLKKQANQLTAKQAHELVSLFIVSYHTRLNIGSVITIDQKDELFSAELKNRQFVITEIQHYITKDGNFYNNAIAVPVDHSHNVRMTDTSGISCGPIPAIVKEVKAGAAKVQFISDIENSVSKWIKILTPSTSYGGMSIWPQKNERVLVFSEGDSLEDAPFILGSFYTKQLAAKLLKEGASGIFTKDGGIYFDEKGTLKIWADLIEIISRNELILEGNKFTKINCKVGEIPVLQSKIQSNQ